MTQARIAFVGAELYFDDLDRAIRFYHEVLGLEISEQQDGTYAKFDTAGGFLCLERRGLETYPSQDKAVVFLEVADLKQIIAALGRDRILMSEVDATHRQPWAVLHDPEGYNVILLQTINAPPAR